METCFWEGLGGHFQEELTEVGRHTLNVGSASPWDESCFEKVSLGYISLVSTVSWYQELGQPPSCTVSLKPHALVHRRYCYEFIPQDSHGD